MIFLTITDKNSEKMRELPLLFVFLNKWSHNCGPPHKPSSTKTYFFKTLVKNFQKIPLANSIEHSWWRTQLLGFCADSPVNHLSLPMGYATNFELMHHDCLLVGREIRWLNLLDGINQSNKINCPRSVSNERLKNITSLYFFQGFWLNISLQHIESVKHFLRRQKIEKLYPLYMLDVRKLKCSIHKVNKKLI